MSRACLAGSIALLLAASCAHGSARFAAALTTDRATYNAGDKVTLKLANDGEVAWGANVCESELQRMEPPDHWTTAVVAFTACPDVITVQRKGSVTSRDFALAPSLPAGTYRFVTAIETDGGSDLQLIGTPFVIAAATAREP